MRLRLLKVRPLGKASSLACQNHLGLASNATLLLLLLSLQQELLLVLLHEPVLLLKLLQQQPLLGVQGRLVLLEVAEHLQLLLVQVECGGCPRNPRGGLGSPYRGCLPHCHCSSGTLTSSHRSHGPW